MTGTWLVVLAYMVVINFVTYLAFWIDKERARAGQYRVPERTLLLLALMGGSPSALLAQRRMRHKTRKQPFAGLLAGIALLQAVAVAGFAMKAL